MATEITQEATEQITSTEEKPVASEESTQETEAAVDWAAKFKELEASTKTRIEDLKKERKRLEADNIAKDNAYKGLQRQVGPKLTEAAEIRKQAQANQEMKSDITDLKTLVETMAKRVLDESEVQGLEDKRKQVRMEAELQSYKDRAAQPVSQTTNVAPVIDIVAQRKEFLDNFFPGAKVDPNDPAIDWAEDIAVENPNVAFQRVQSSVFKLVGKRERKQAEKQAEEMFAQESQKLQQNMQAEIEKIRAEAVREANQDSAKLVREETEKRVRAMGMDTGKTPVSEGQRTLRTVMTEELDEGLLTKGPAGSRERKESVDKYNASLEALRARLTTR